MRSRSSGRSAPSAHPLRRHDRPRQTLVLVSITALLAFVALSGCSLSASFAVDSGGVRGPFGAGADEAAAESYDRGVQTGATPGEAPAPESATPGEAHRAGGLPIALGDAAPPAAPDSSSGERMRVSTGSLELSVARVERARRAIIDYVDAVDGYVERSTAESLVVRVPAARFPDAMERIAGEGEVRSRIVETADVTEQYSDLERRLEIATASRERLYELLERSAASSEDADERVAILREIRRLTEEVERLRSSLETLAELVSYSRIAVRLVPRIQATQVMRDAIPFPWIARLDPLEPSVGEAARPVELAVPDAFAILEDGRRVRAESADGTRFRAGGRPNEPAGDAAFWSEALAFHLAEFYRSADAFEAGPYRGIVFESGDREPYAYLVAVAPRDDELVVFEAFFPSTAAREEHLDSLERMLSGGRLR